MSFFQKSSSISIASSERRSLQQIAREGWRHVMIRQYSGGRLLLVGLMLLGCARPYGVPGSSVQAEMPYTPAQALALKQAGRVWSNRDIRAHYLQLVAGIAAADQARRKAGQSAEARAHAAYETRHNARITCRAMMADPAEVEDLRRRDLAKYGHPDGPTFAQLVAREQAKGLQADAVYEAIVRSAQKTDPSVNALLAQPPGTAQ